MKLPIKVGNDVAHGKTKLKLGNIVTYKIFFSDGSVGTISTHITEFDSTQNIRKVGKTIQKHR